MIHHYLDQFHITHLYIHFWNYTSTTYFVSFKIWEMVLIVILQYRKYENINIIPSTSMKLRKFNNYFEKSIEKRHIFYFDYL